MSRFSFPVVLPVTLGVFIIAISSQARAAQLPGAQIASATVNNQPSSDYGAGGHSTQTSSASGVLQGAVYDPQGNIRQEETDTYATSNGAQYKTEKQYFDFDPKLHLTLGADFKYDLHHNLTFTDFTHYGLHGERTGEEITNYTPTGYQIKDWSLGTHQWYTNPITYKTPLPAGTSAMAPLTPTNTSIGVLFPRSYLPGETITGSLWPSSYAENFKTVPGLSEYSFPIQLYHLPDGSPEWSSLAIGIKGDGYVPVNPNGTFSLHIPFDWKGPLQLQARQPDPVAGVGPTDAQLNIDPPAAAPTLPSNQFPNTALVRFGFYSKNHLVELWEDACDDEEILDNLYAETTPDWPRIDAVEEELHDIYDDIDEIEDDMPPQEVISLAQSMYREAIDFPNWLGGRPNLSTDDKDDLKDSSSWARFLEDEIDYNKFLAGWELVNPLMQPYFTNPVLVQDKLGEIGGSFPLDPYSTYLHIDNFSITPLAATPNNWYFMPPSGLTAGLHNYIIDSPLYPETIFPVFSMTLYMSADNLNLLKGQSTTYRVVLSGLNGLPGGAWGGAFDPSDLVGSSELSAAQKAVGTTRNGYITLDITNGSPGVIAMRDQFLTFSAASFVPSGSHETDGGVTALVKGSFTINGVARAYLEPEIGVGIPPGTSTLVRSSDPLSGALGTNWFPPISVNYDPVAFSNSSFMTSCPRSSAAPTTTAPTPTGGTPAPAPCVESVIDDLMPPKPAPADNQVKDNTPNPPKPDQAKLDQATKRVQEATEKEKAALQNLLSYQNGVDSAFKNGLNQAPQELQDKLKQAEDRLEKAKQEKQSAAATQEATPTTENQNLLLTAEMQEADAQSAYDAAKKNVIDSFDSDAKSGYDAAVNNYDKAVKDWIPTENEKRAAYDALEKLQQPPPAPTQQVM